jgi:hypothetical protein
MNAKTDPVSTQVTVQNNSHVQIIATSDNGKWTGQYDFYPNRLDFTMTQVSAGYHYWVQFEGVPNGAMDESDFWYASVDTVSHPINESFLGDLPAPEWFAFGDVNTTRMLYLLHHEDDAHPDNYVSRPYMTVLGFGRSEKNKYLNTPQRFSIGFIESNEHAIIAKTISTIVE